MLTRWSDSASKVPHANYPRPQLRREDWVCLNGAWEFAVTPLAAPEPKRWSGEITVPFCIESKLSGVEGSLSNNERLWYRRSFDIPQGEVRWILHFGAVDETCGVWVNDAFVGSHSGAFDPFSFDVTEFVTTGSNTLVVGVTDPTSRGEQPRGKQHSSPNGIWYTPVSGIWQTVWLEPVPLLQHIAELQVHPAADCDGVDLVAFLNRPSRDPALAVRAVARLNGELVAQTFGRPDRVLSLRLADPRLWHPDHPVLYDLAIDLVRLDHPPMQNADPQSLERNVPSHGKTERALYSEIANEGSVVIDHVDSYFALRRVSREIDPLSGKPAVFINGEPQFMLGPLDQGWWPDGLHTPPSDEALLYELEFLKDSGFNMLRKHIKVESARYYYHCDRLGIFVWQDMPSGFLPAQFVAPNDEGEGLRRSDSGQQFELALMKMVAGLRHFASVVVWVVHNEGWGQFDSKGLCERLRSIDPTRLINANSGWLDVGVGDFVDEHNYEAKLTAPAGDGHRAVVIGEFGGIGWPVAGHQFNPDIRNWGYQTLHQQSEVQAAYVDLLEQIQQLRQRDGLCAAVYTQTSDVEGEVNGLLTYDRDVEKLPREWLRKHHNRLIW